MDTCLRIIAIHGLLGLAAPALVAEDLTGRVEVAWRSYELDRRESDGLRQYYELSYDRRLTEAFGVRLGLRAVDDASGATLAGETRTSDYRAIEPRLRLDYRRPTLDLEAWWSGLETKSVETPDDGESIEREQTFDRLRAFLAYRPLGLPSFSFDGYRREATHSELAGRLIELGGLGRIDYRWAGFHASAAGGGTRLEDGSAGFVRTSEDLQGQADYSKTLWDGRLSLSGLALRSASTIEREVLGAGGTAVPDPVGVTGAFQTWDETPSDHFDQPLLPNPRLNDGDLESPTNLAIGPADRSDLNLALDFGRSAEVDEIRVVARDSLGNPVTTGGPVVWDVYESADGIRWTPVPGGAESRFDPARSFWSVRFQQRLTRWIQVVTFFVNTVPTELTEVQALGSEDVPVGAPSREEIVLDSGRGNLDFRATERLSISWQRLWTRSRNTRGSGRETGIVNEDQLVSLYWALPADLSLEIRGEDRQQERTEGVDRDVRDYRGWTGVVHWQPGTNLDTALEVTRGEEDLGGGVLALERELVRAFLRPWRGLEISIEGGRQVQELGDSGIVVETPSASGYVKTWLTPSLILTVQGSTNRASIRGELPTELAIDVPSDRWYADLQWKPSGRLNMGVRLGRAEGGGSSEPIQGYRLHWSPFSGGAVVLTARYDENVDPARDRRARRLVVTPTWAMNPNLRLNLSLQQLETSTGDVTSDSRSFTVSLSSDF